jgi:hypothetical protein
MDEDRTSYFWRMIRRASEKEQHDADQKEDASQAAGEVQDHGGDVDPARPVEAEVEERAGGTEADAQAAAGRRDVLEARKVRVHLIDGIYYDIAVMIPWPDWVASLNHFQGIIFDHGFVPLHRINVIGPLTEASKPEPPTTLPDNVVLLRKPT